MTTKKKKRAGKILGDKLHYFVSIDIYRFHLDDEDERKVTSSSSKATAKKRKSRIEVAASEYFKLKKSTSTPTSKATYRAFMNRDGPTQLGSKQLPEVRLKKY